MNKIVVMSDDGALTDITEGVRCLYELLIEAIGSGEGYLSAEETILMVNVAKTCGFGDSGQAQQCVVPCG